MRQLQLFEDEGRGEVLATFHGLRQQAEKDNKEPYACLSDFIAPQVRPHAKPGALLCTLCAHRHVAAQLQSPCFACISCLVEGHCFFQGSM